MKWFWSNSDGFQFCFLIYYIISHKFIYYTKQLVPKIKICITFTHHIHTQWITSNEIHQSTTENIELKLGFNHAHRLNLILSENNLSQDNLYMTLIHNRVMTSYVRRSLLGLRSQNFDPSKISNSSCILRFY